MAEGRQRLPGRGLAERSAGARRSRLAALSDAQRIAGDTPAIHTVELAKRYGPTLALAGLSMTVPRGEIFGFLGPNGAGKTTAVKLLLGLARPSGGEAWILGAPIGDVAARRRVGYLPELFRYQGWLTAREVVALHCQLAGLPRHVWPTEIAAQLSAVGLSDRADDRVATFSKGMQQRLGLAVALIGGPELVLLDEPTSALDPVGRHDVRAVLRGLKERAVAVFLNSHLLSEVEAVCDRVAIVDRGRVIATGPLRDLLTEGVVRIRATDVADAALAALTRFGKAETDGEWLTFRGMRSDAIPDLVSELVRRGARVYAVEAKRETLEGRFLRLLEQEVAAG